MIQFTPEQIYEIKELQEESTQKLLQALAGNDSMQPGILDNEFAPCLIGHAIGNLTEILKIINEAEKES